MKNLLLTASLLCATIANASRYEWSSPPSISDCSMQYVEGLYNAEIIGGIAIDAAQGTCWTVEGPFLVYSGGQGLMIKQKDHATTSMSAYNYAWIVAFMGESIANDSFSAELIELTDWYDSSLAGGTQIDTPGDFYLGFMSPERPRWSADGLHTPIDKGLVMYGWMRLSVDDNLRMSILDYDVNPFGGPITVGEHWSSEPEPAAGTLAALGLAALLLRRRFGR